jgi:hypothetical protein
VDLVHAAVTDQPGEVTITGEDADESNSLLTLDLDLEEYRVPGVRLDDIVMSHAIGHIDFLKMNVEGAESLAIRGMDHAIARTDRVCICCHDFMADHGGSQTMRTKNVVTSYLLERGFSVLDNDPTWPDYRRDHVHAVRPSAFATAQGSARKVYARP